MPSSYTTSLRLVLPVTGELTGTWGTTVNTGLTQLLDTAIAGYASVAMTDANYTLTNSNGAADEARNMAIEMTGTLTAARNVICPTADKLYFFKNSTTGGFAVTLKTSGGTGISVPNGRAAVLLCDGTNVVDATNYLTTLYLGNALGVASGGTGLTAAGASGNFLRSTGSAWVSSAGTGMVFLSETTASNSATVDIETTFSSTYDAYMLVATACIVQTDGAALYLRTKQGGSYLTSNYAYRTAVPDSSDLADPLLEEDGSATNSTGFQSVSGSAAAQIVLFPSVGNDASEACNFTVTVSSPASTAVQKSLRFEGSAINAAGDIVNMNGAGKNSATSALTGVRVYASSGNIVSGSFRLYGITNS